MRNSKVDLIYTLLQGDDEFLIKCIKLLWQKQTDDEKATVSTMHNNYVGFSKVDGSILGTLADNIERGYKPNITELNIVRIMMLKYAKQLTNYINEEDL